MANKWMQRLISDVQSHECLLVAMFTLLFSIRSGYSWLQQCNPHKTKNWPYSAMTKPSCIWWLFTCAAQESCSLSLQSYFILWIFQIHYFTSYYLSINWATCPDITNHNIQKKLVLFNVFIATFGSRKFSYYYPWLISNQTILTPTQNIDYLSWVYSLPLLILLALTVLILSLTDLPRGCFHLIKLS